MSDVDASDTLKVRHLSAQRENLMEPTRLELDFPVAIVDSTANNIQLPNGKDMQSWISSSFQPGDILTVHVVVESTGLSRQICKWIDPSQERNRYTYPCNHVTDSSGVCPLQSDHDKKNREALQPSLEEAE